VPVQGIVSWINVVRTALVRLGVVSAAIIRIAVTGTQVVFLGGLVRGFAVFRSRPLLSGLYSVRLSSAHLFLHYQKGESPSPGGATGSQALEGLSALVVLVLLVLIRLAADVLIVRILTSLAAASLPTAGLLAT
jgi:hypothetical protein